MEILIGLVILILVISGIWTLLITGKSDTDYRSSTKRNTTNLTLIYVVVIGLSLIALAIYIWLL
ncbi:hypothetical protein SM124_16170 [Bacillus sp. 31A1R]|uniref:Uncharacterized protein n=1 Tax=Robertmurraya mangrovi TaxID=3098077 RepID=A0ABU5J1F6_9BACI|nr:hypothetical protein [Bacillus sp. 31A1R]MDZ5473254.1 hypothetical protein [Bacillus sp. 31A1R]